MMNYIEYNMVQSKAQRNYTQMSLAIAQYTNLGFDMDSVCKDWSTVNSLNLYSLERNNTNNCLVD